MLAEIWQQCWLPGSRPGKKSEENQLGAQCSWVTIPASSQWQTHGRMQIDRSLAGGWFNGTAYG